MNHPEDDRDLRGLFAETRSTEAERTPPFRRLWAAAREQRRGGTAPQRLRLSYLAAGTAAALVVVAGAVLWWMTSTIERETAPSITEWRAPSDILLETPGIELIRDLPSLEAGPAAVLNDESFEPPASLPERRLQS